MIKRVTLFLLLAGPVFGAALPFHVSLLNKNILLVRASVVGTNFTQQLKAAELTNKLSGMVLDLRFAHGQQPAQNDYLTNSKTPLMILINAQTRGSAATLAEQLRSRHRALLIGSTNSPGGIIPDIAVNVSAAAEKHFQENPYARLDSAQKLPSLSTNEFLPFVDHTREADLVRQRIRDGENLDAPPPPPASKRPPPPVICDPELARAVDLLKAIAIFQTGRH